jgi:hypothetical protein
MVIHDVFRVMRLIGTTTDLPNRKRDFPDPWVTEALREAFIQLILAPLWS